MNKFFITILAALLILPAMAGFSDVQPIQRLIYMQGNEQLFSVDLSDIWNIEMENGDITGVSDDGKIWFYLGDIENKVDIETAKDEINATMARYFTNIEVVEKIEELDLNGLKAHALEGIAKQEGKDVIFFVLLFDLDTADTGALIFIMDPAAERLHLGAMHNLTVSITRL